MHTQRVFSLHRSPSHLSPQLRIFNAQGSDDKKFKLGEPPVAATRDINSQKSLNRPGPKTRRSTHVERPRTPKMKRDASLPNVIEKSNIYQVMGKGVKTDFQEVIAMEDEFKCYLRPVIEDEESGWGFVAGNINP